MRQSLLREKPLSAWAEAFLFLAARAEHVAQVIRPALRQGETEWDEGRGTRDEKRSGLWSRKPYDLFLRILHPFAPHITDELWERLGKEGSLFTQSWAEVDEEALVQETVTIVVQVNGRIRGRIVVPIDADEATIKELALQEPNVRAHLEGREIKRIIIVPRKIVNIVV